MTKSLKSRDTGDGSLSDRIIMLSALKPAHENSCSARRSSHAPIVVFTGPPGNPDQSSRPQRCAKKKKKAAAKKDDVAEKQAQSRAARKSAGKTRQDSEDAAKNGATPAKPCQAERHRAEKGQGCRRALERERSARADPADRPHRLSRRRQDDAAQQAAERSRRSRTPRSSSTNSARSASTICWSNMSSDNVMLLQSGCLCCTMRGDLVDALETLLRDLDNGRCTFSRVVMETTGLADPAPVLHTAMSHPYLVMRYRLDGVVTLVDAVNGEATLDAHPEAVKQAAVADRLVLTKTDLASTRQLEQLMARLRVLNPAAPILDAAKGEAMPDRLLGCGLYDPDRKIPDVKKWLAAEAYAPRSSPSSP